MRISEFQEVSKAVLGYLHKRWLQFMDDNTGGK